MDFIDFCSSYRASPFLTFGGTSLDILQHDWNMVCRSSKGKFLDAVSKYSTFICLIKLNFDGCALGNLG